MADTSLWRESDINDAYSPKMVYSNIYSKNTQVFTAIFLKNRNNRMVTIWKFSFMFQFSINN
jgi:hypothetical protein